MSCKCTELPPSPYPIAYGFKCEYDGEQFWDYDREAAFNACQDHLAGIPECSGSQSYECTKTLTCAICNLSFSAKGYSTTSKADACMKAQADAEEKLDAHTCGGPAEPCIIMAVFGVSLLAQYVFPHLRLVRKKALMGWEGTRFKATYYKFSGWVLRGCNYV